MQLEDPIKTLGVHRIPIKIHPEVTVDLKVKVQKAVDRIGINPKLVTILVGNDPASKVYLNMKKRISALIGIDSDILELDENASKEKKRL